MTPFGITSGQKRARKRGEDHGHGIAIHPAGGAPWYIRNHEHQGPPQRTEMYSFTIDSDQGTGPRSFILYSVQGALERLDQRDRGGQRSSRGKIGRKEGRKERNERERGGGDRERGKKRKYTRETSRS